MRTTVDLPDQLLRNAKARAAARGETLRELLERAVSHELGTALAPSSPGRVQLPLVGSGQPGTVDISSATIEAAFAAEDADAAAGR